MGLGISSGAIRATGPVQSMRDQWIDQQMSTPAISTQTVGQFLALANPTTKGVDVSFQLSDTTGINLVTLVRATVMDLQQAIVLQTWAPKVAGYTWADTDAVLQQSGQAYYWVLLAPSNTNGSELEAGPQYILLNPSLLPPLALSGVSASHGAAQNGAVLVTCNVSAIPSGNSVKIYVSGYEGNPSAVAVAQHGSAPLQFMLQATGETITIRAIAVSPGGAESATGPTCTLLLNGTATVPAQPQGLLITQIATGNQVSFPSSLEVGVTSYQLYRGQRGSGFGAATLLTTIAASSAGTILYLDTAGLTGDFEYYVVAVSASGSSSPSPAANPIVLYSSSQLPPNSVSNQLGGGTIDSLDGGASATIRIYGGGGPGTGWTKTTGYGTATRPAGSITGLAYSTQYFVLYAVATATYISGINYTDTLPDGYEWVGTITTAPVGAGGGTVTATGTAGLDGTGHVAGVTMTNDGYGYASATVAFSGGGGSGAAGNAICTHGRVVAVTITNGGSGYGSPPTVTFTLTGGYTGGGGASGTGGSRYVLTQP